MAVKKTQMYRRNLDGTETNLNPLTESQYVLMENGQTVQEVLSDRDSDKYTPVITNSSSTFKVGQGDNVDLSSSMKEGAYDSCVLKGKTMVNCIQEPSSKDVVLPYEFEDGQYVTINDTKENGALGVELKGQTLVNLLAQDSSTNMYTTRTQIDRGYRYTQQYNVSMGATRFQWDITNSGHNRLKINTKYCVQFTVKVKKRRNVRVLFEGGIEYTTTLAENSTTNIKCIVQSGEVLKRFFVYVYPPTDESYTGDTFDVLDFMTIEYQEGMENWDIPYFEGMASCKMPILHTVGKNLFDVSSYIMGEMESRYYSASGNQLQINALDQRHTTEYYTYELKKGQSLTLSTTPKIPLRIYDTVTDTMINSTVDGVLTYTPSSDTKVGLKFIANTFPTLVNVQLEQNSTPTSHEDHKTSILSLPEEVVLGGLGSARDTLNTVTGKYTKRTDTMTVMNYKNSLGSGLIEGAWSIVVTPPNKKWQSTMLCVSDKFSMGGGHSDRNCGFYENPANFVFFDRTVNSADEFIAKYGDFSFTYILENPIITKINLPSTLKSWNTTTHIYSEITENSLYPILSHSNPTYPVILKPSTKYSIVANSYSNSHANSAINFNLGGATASTTVGNRVTTITTPSTLSNELLTMSGRGNRLNNVMVIEGDIVGDEPYFEGICDVKSPTLSNCGKNLFDGHLEQGSINTNNGSLITTTTAIRCDDYIELVGEKTYTISKTKGTTVISVIIFGENKNFTRATWDTTFTLNANEKYIKFTDGQNDLTNQYQIEEGVNSTPYEPYKSNILSCNGDKIELTEDMFEQGHCGYNPSVIGSTYDEFKSVASPSFQATRVRSKSLVKVKPNTTYFIKADSTKYNFGMQGFDNNKLSIGYDTHWQTDHVFTTPANMCYASLHIRKNNDGNLTPANVDYNCIQLSEVDKTIVLRSLPNGVCDTLNVETGEYVQRIGEVVFDGSNDEGWFIHSENGFVNLRFRTTILSGKMVKHHYTTVDMNSDKMACYPNSEWSIDREGMERDSVYLSIRKNIETLDGFKQWLSQSPITVQYPLATPIVSTIDVQGFPYAYTNGHVQLSSGHSGQSLTPKVEYSLSANKTGQINSNTKRVSAHQKQLDDFEAMMLTSMVQSAYDKAILQFDYEMQMMSLGGE